MSVLESGMRFGKLTIVKLVQGGNANERKYRCICDCGCEKITSEDNLKRGHTKSCGCLRKGHGGSKKKNIILGSDSKLYRIWFGMKTRCFNHKNPNYKNYGARGITICDEWMIYDSFKEWAINNGYVENNTIHYSIDRIDVNGNYEPNNCRWATPKEQMNNTRRNTVIEYAGMRKTLSQWADYIGLIYSTFMSRYSRNWSMMKIVNTPAHYKKRR